MATSHPSSFPPDLVQIVRTGLNLGESAEIRVSEVTRWTNLNHVFAATADGRSLYLKLVTEKPKNLDIRLPRERIFFEAEAITRFRALCGEAVLVPEVLFVDRGDYAIGMSDVGQGRKVLLEIIQAEYPLLVAQAAPLGLALGRVHAASRGMAPFRPEAFERTLQAVIVNGLLAPGARALFDDYWPQVAARMQAPGECLVHGDLWAKNLLVAEDAPPAIVDFEGASIGDPGFDIGTLLAVAAIPALEQPALTPACIAFSEALVAAYCKAARETSPGDSPWAPEACRRAFLYVGTFLAARGFGPFAYPLSDPARKRLAGLARSLTVSPVDELGEYCARLAERSHAGETAAGARVPAGNLRGCEA